jgi:hypothetical protein
MFLKVKTSHSSLKRSPGPKFTKKKKKRALVGPKKMKKNVNKRS